VPGFYEVRSLETSAPVRLAAVNVDPAESDLAALDPEELAGRSRGRRRERAAAHGAGADHGRARGRKRSGEPC